jgi:hypothetical protein
MFTLENTLGKFRAESVGEAMGYLTARAREAPGSELVVHGLGRLVFLRAGHVMLYPMTLGGPQELSLDDIQGMLEAMVAGVEPPEEVPEEAGPVDDPDVVEYVSVEFRRKMFWRRRDNLTGRREAYVVTGRNVVWASDYPVGAILTVRTQVEITRRA